MRQAIDRNQIQPIAPAHFDHECAAVLMRWYRSNKITRARLEFACNQLAALQIQIHAYPSNAAELVALALRYRLTPFDAVYFDMAVTEAVPIATLDGGLMQAAKSFKIKYWQP